MVWSYMSFADQATEPLRTSYGPSNNPVAIVLNPAHSDASHWQWLLDAAADDAIERARGPIERILRVVQSRGCQTVVVELDYVDLDYLSEYGKFWAGRFVGRPATATRVHFFEARFDARQLFELPAEHGYLGYFVIRPTELGPVGRTVLAPPQELVGNGTRLTSVRDRPSFFGHPLEVHGVPFCQQDGELLRCAHAAAWVAHYTAHHRRVTGRVSTGDIASLPSYEGSKHRALPSNGLTAEQLQSVFSAVGIPAFFYAMELLPPLPADLPAPPTATFGSIRKKAAVAEQHKTRVADERILRVVCKYINSGFPVIVLTDRKEDSHAFTLVGWQQRRDGPVRLIACDDQKGPYEIIESPTLDQEERGVWKALMLPLPANVFLTGEAAESRARQLAGAWAKGAGRDSTEDKPPEDPLERDMAAIAPHLTKLDGPISVRTRLIRGRTYKAVVGRQGRDPEAVRVARMANLPLWVWVVEFHNREARVKGDPCVLAEVVFDSTSHDDVPNIDLVSTRSIALDVERIDDEDGVEDPVAIGDADGRMWRSMISDPRVVIREYGLTDA